MKRIGDYIPEILQLKDCLTNLLLGGTTEIATADYSTCKTENYFYTTVPLGQNDQLVFSSFKQERYIWKHEFGIVFSLAGKDSWSDSGSTLIITLLKLIPGEYAQQICRLQFVNHKTTGLFQIIHINALQMNDLQEFDRISHCTRIFLGYILPLDI